MEERHEVARLLPYDPRPQGIRKAEELGLVPRSSSPYSLYKVTVPYARSGAVDETEALMELQPYATLAYSSALLFHGLTDELPKELTLAVPRDGRGGQLPLGTKPSDWEGLELVRGTPIPRIFDRPVRWFRVAPEKFFGMAEYRPHGYPVRVMTPERTLLDGLQHPELCGGIEAVLRAWFLARDLLDVGRVIQYTERLDVTVMRQRVGYVLEELGLAHHALEGWRRGAHRGGSSKLVASSPYASVYSERWNLSLNAPVWALTEETG